ncbi:MAG TPA: ester cyclase [Gemmatimonadales bacterium]|nr:ester cyclase [Gemmatimonadales bacterium]
MRQPGAVTSRARGRVLCRVRLPHDQSRCSSGGRAAIATAAQGFTTAIPDLVVTMDSLKTTGPTVGSHWTLTGTDTGLGGTGRSVHISGYEEWTFGPDGRIAQSLGHFDEAANRVQLQGDG